jgi:hypothetical protein
MAGIFMPVSGGGMLERLAAIGPAEARIYDRFPVQSRLPVADVFRDGVPKYFESAADWTDYPASLRLQIEIREGPSVAVLPFRHDERVIGVMYLVFEPGTALRVRARELEEIAARWG